MSNITVTNNDLNSPILESAEFRDDVIEFAGADTLAPGTIMARDSVSGNLVPYVIGGATNENGIPKAVLTYEVVATGAGNVNVRIGVSGKYRKEKLVVDADGDASSITSAIADQLRDYGLVPVDVQELNIQDNQ